MKQFKLKFNEDAPPLPDGFKVVAYYPGGYIITGNKNLGIGLNRNGCFTETEDELAIFDTEKEAREFFWETDKKLSKSSVEKYETI